MTMELELDDGGLVEGRESIGVTECRCIGVTFFYSPTPLLPYSVTPLLPLVLVFQYSFDPVIFSICSYDYCPGLIRSVYSNLQILISL